VSTAINYVAFVGFKTAEERLTDFSSFGGYNRLKEIITVVASKRLEKNTARRRQHSTILVWLLNKINLKEIQLVLCVLECLC